MEEAGVDPGGNCEVSELEQCPQEAAKVKVELGETTVVVERGSDGGVRAYTGYDRDEIPVTRAFWFAWSSFYPNTQVID